MPNYAKATLMGHVTRDPELKTINTKNGEMAVCDFAIAVNDPRTKEASFFDVTFFGKKAEVIKEYVSKGDPFFVEGQLKIETWEAKDGSGKRSKVKVIGNDFQFLSGKKDDAPAEAAPANNEQVPF